MSAQRKNRSRMLRLAGVTTFLAVATALLASVVPAASTYEDAAALYAGRKYEEAKTAFEEFVSANPDDPRAVDADYYRCLCFWHRESYFDFIWNTYLFYSRYDHRIPYMSRFFCSDTAAQLMAPEIDERIKNRLSTLKEITDPEEMEKAEFDLALLYDIRSTRRDWVRPHLEPEKEAVAAYRKFISKYPEGKYLPEATYRLACVSRGSDPETASSLHNKCIREYPGTESARLSEYFLGVLYLFRGQADQGTLQFDNYLAKYPDSDISGFVYFYLGEIYKDQKNDLDKAAGAYLTYLEKYPKVKFRQTVMLHLGECYMKKGDTAEMERILAECVRVDPTLTAAAWAIPNLMESYAKRGDVAAMLSLYRDVACRFPNSEPARLILKAIKTQTSPGTANLQTIVEFCRNTMAGSLDGECSRAALRILRGAYLSAYPPDEALKSFRDFYAEYDPNPGNAVLAWVECLEEEESYDQAIPLLQSMIDEKPDGSDVPALLLRMARCRHLLGGSNDKVIEILDLIRTKNDVAPALLAEAETLRARVMLEARDYSGAVVILSELSAKSKGTPYEGDVLFYYACSKAALGEHYDAVDVFRRYLEICPDAPKADSVREYLRTVDGL